MRSIRMIALCGAAVLGLAGSANAGQSSAREKAETRELNLEQAQANAPAPVATDAGSSLAADAPPAAAPTMPVQVAAAAPISNTQPALAPMALNSLSNPPTRIANARVVDDKGAAVGAVRKVDIDGGKPSKVEIELLGSQQVVALNAAQLSYDESSNVLTAALDKNQIVQLPPTPRG